MCRVCVPPWEGRGWAARLTDVGLTAAWPPTGTLWALPSAQTPIWQPPGAACACSGRCAGAQGTARVQAGERRVLAWEAACVPGRSPHLVHVSRPRPDLCPGSTGPVASPRPPRQPTSASNWAAKPFNGVCAAAGLPGPNNALFMSQQNAGERLISLSEKRGLIGTDAAHSSAKGQLLCDRNQVCARGSV